MGKSQIALVAGSCVLVLLLFFGFDRIPSEQKLVEKSRALNFETADWSGILNADKKSLDASDVSYLKTLENVVENTQIDSQRIETLKQLSGAWFERGKYASAGHYAEKIAEFEETESTWAIAGATFAYALSGQFTNDVKDACLKHAVHCFENALSLNPDNIEHRINLAICYVEHPLQNNAMHGIQSLLALNEKFPEDTSVLYHLARFGMQTGQYEKAIDRLKKAIEIDPSQKRMHCLLERAYRETGSLQLAQVHQDLCMKE